MQVTLPDPPRPESWDPSVYGPRELVLLDAWTRISKTGLDPVRILWDVASSEEEWEKLSASAGNDKAIGSNSFAAAYRRVGAHGLLGSVRARAFMEFLEVYDSKDFAEMMNAMGQKSGRRDPRHSRFKVHSAQRFLEAVDALHSRLRKVNKPTNRKKAKPDSQLRAAAKREACNMMFRDEPHGAQLLGLTRGDHTAQSAPGIRPGTQVGQGTLDNRPSFRRVRN